MSVQGYKNLIKIALLSDDSFQPLLKKSDQYRKITQLSIDHFQTIVKNFEVFQANFHKLLFDYDQQIDIGQLNIPQYYHEYVQLYRNMHSQQKSFTERLSNNFKELTSLCNNIFSNFSNLILSFQATLRSYKSHEQILFELSKKYFRTHKSMLMSIQSYKSSFTDVKLIYNMDQKNKRYNSCEGLYKNLIEELQTIEQKITQLSSEKQQIIDSYKDIEKQFKLTLKSIGSKKVALSKSFLYDFCQMQKIFITYLAEKKFSLEKIELKTFFNSETKLSEQEYYNVEIDHSKCEFIPVFVKYHEHLKEQHYPVIAKLMNNYIKQMQQKVQKRKYLNKKILEFTQKFIKNFEKGYYSNLKDINTNFQKIKKRLSQIFGNKLCSFLKSNNSVFELSVGINEKLLKRTPSKLKLIESYLNQQIKILEILSKQFRATVDKFLKKKEVKKIIQVQKQSQFTQEEASSVDIAAFKSQLAEKSTYIMHLVEGFVEKLKKNQDLIKFQYNAFVNDLSVSTNEFYSLCCQYQQLYFGEQDFMNNYKKYQIDIDKTLQNQSKFFGEINFGNLLKDQPGKITFESDIGKAEEFKKLKRPTEIQIEKNGLNPKRQQSSSKKQAATDKQINDLPELANLTDKTSSKEISNNSEKFEASKQKNQNSNKYQEFIMSKINFLPQQKFYKSFSCGLSDKIILTGRLYITNKRLCFHSKFNPNTVFFGETFMQIPKKDIKKIEKRLNAIVFDNSISITTVNGQVFFTSFFSRNQAYNMICDALEVNTDDCMFQPEQLKVQDKIQVQIKQEADDIPEQKLVQRTQNIQRLLADFNYKQLHRGQFSFPKLDALKFFKYFEQGVEFSYQRKKYSSFTAFFKDLIEHKDYSIGQWSPNISQFLNSSNIKSETPQKFTRQISCLVPISNSGVPFMPKHAKSEQTTTLFIYSKDKIVIQSMIQNSGVPYSSCFNLRIKKVIQTTSQNSCSLTIYFYLNFVENTMMRSVIQTKATEETKAVNARYEQQIKKYLKYLEKSRQKLIKANDKQDQSKEIMPDNEQNENQLNVLRESQTKLKAELKKTNIQIEHGKKILLGSIILNILLILILLH